MTSSRNIACWSRWASDLPSGCHFAHDFDDTATLRFKILNGAVLMTAWRRAGIRPIFDAISKQTNREYHRMSRTNRPILSLLRLLSAALLTVHTAWVTCCRRVTSLKSWVGHMIQNLFPPPRDMFNGQLWLEKTDFKKCVNCYFPNSSHWYAYCNINYILVLQYCNLVYNLVCITRQNRKKFPASTPFYYYM